ncbi:MAG: hypothetical protein ACHQUC_00245 [Chlamydiales bacterium]
MQLPATNQAPSTQERLPLSVFNLDQVRGALNASGVDLDAIDQAQERLARYRPLTPNASFKEKLDYYVFRIWNFVKAFFFHSDWRLAKKEIAAAIIKPLLEDKSLVHYMDISKAHAPQFKRLLEAVVELAMCISIDSKIEAYTRELAPQLYPVSDTKEEDVSDTKEEDVAEKDPLQTVLKMLISQDLVDSSTRNAVLGVWSEGKKTFTQVVTDYSFLSKLFFVTMLTNGIDANAIQNFEIPEDFSALAGQFNAVLRPRSRQAAPVSDEGVRVAFNTKTPQG